MPKKSCSTCTYIRYTSADRSCWECSQGGPDDGWANHPYDPEPHQVWCSDWISEKKHGVEVRLKANVRRLANLCRQAADVIRRHGEDGCADRLLRCVEKEEVPS